MSADEEGEIKPEREKTDGGRTLIHEGRQGEDTLKQIKRVAHLYHRNGPSIATA